MNALTHAQSTELAVKNKNYFEEYADSARSNKIVGDLLKFNKGEWLKGQNNAEIELGRRMIAALDEMMVGWLKWENEKVVDMRMGRVADGYRPPPRKELGDDDESKWERDNEGRPKDCWSFTNYIILVDEKTNELFTYAPSSKGGLSSLAKLAGTYGKHVRQIPSEYPVVSLDRESYMHAVYKKVYVPALNVKAWVDKEPASLLIAGDAAASAEAEAEEKPEPKAKAKKADPVF